MSPVARPASLVAAAALALSLAPAARADEPVVPTSTDLTLSADAGAVAWARPEGRTGYRLVAAAEAAPGAVTPHDVGPVLPAEPRFDVGRGRDGAATIVWADGCSAATRRCTVRALPASAGATTAPTVLTRIPYAGGGTPAVALDGTRLVFTQKVYKGSGRTRQACDSLRTTMLSGGGSGSSRQLVLGTGCVPILQLDVEGRWVAILLTPHGHQYDGGGPTEARVIRTDGHGSRSLELESQGEEPNRIDAVAIDRGRVYTALAGIRQANLVRRFDPATGRRSDARLFASFAGGFARDGGRQYWVQPGSGGVGDTCPYGPGASCLLVAGTDPWAGSRLLLPEVTLTAAPLPLYVDDSLTLAGTVTRRRASRTQRGPDLPQAGVPIQLLGSALTAKGPTPATPTGDVASTGTDGRWSIVLRAPQTPGRGFTVHAGAPGSFGTIDASPAVFPTVYAHLAITSAARSGDQVTLAGTISPPQPGRTIGLDRRTHRTCAAYITPNEFPTPSTLDTPAGCLDQFKGVTSAAVSADGARFTITGTGGGGVYRAALGMNAGTVDRPAGETPQVTVP